MALRQCIWCRVMHSSFDLLSRGLGLLGDHSLQNHLTATDTTVAVIR